MLEDQVAEKTFGYTCISQLLRERRSHAFDFCPRQDCGLQHVSSLFRQLFFQTCDAAISARQRRQCDTSPLSLGNFTDSLVKICKASNRQCVVWIDLSGGLVVMDRIIFAAKSL